MSDVSLNDIQRIKSILRNNNLHEWDCASRASADIDGQFPDCTCFVSEDPFDMQSDPPMRIETSSNIAEVVRMHRYSDGRRRAWRRDSPGFGKNITKWTEVPW